MSKTCVRIINKDFYLSDSGLSLHAKNKDYQNFISYTLITQIMQDLIYTNCTVGSIQRQISIDRFNAIEIKLPKNKQLIVDLNPLFAEIEQHTNAASAAHLEYTKLLNELSAEAMPKQDTELLDENLDL
jgi:restriction endonuclease S subunit